MTQLTDSQEDYRILLPILQQNLQPPPNTPQSAFQSLKQHFEQYKQMQQQQSDMNRQYSELNIKFQSLQSQASNLLDLFEEHDSLENVFTKAKLLKQQLNENQLNKQQFQSEIDSGIAAKNQFLLTSNELASMKEQVKTLQGNLFIQQQQNQVLANKNKEIDSLAQQYIEKMNSLQLAYDKTKASNQKLLAENQELLQQRQQFSTESQMSKNELQMSKTQMQDVQLLTSQQQALFESNMSQIKEFQDQKAKFIELANNDLIPVKMSDTLVDIYKYIQNEHNSYQQQLDRLNESNKQYLQQIAQLTRELGENRQNFALLQDITASVMSQYNITEDSVGSVLASIKEKLSELSALKLQNEHERAVCAKQAQELENCEFQLQQLKLQLATSESAKQEVQQQLLEAIAQKDELQKQQIEKQHIMQQQQESLIEKSTSFNSVAKQSEECKITLESTQNELKKHQNDLQFARQQLESLQQQLQQANQQNKAFYEQLKQEKAANAAFLSDKNKFLQVINQNVSKAFKYEDPLAQIGADIIQQLYQPQTYLDLQEQHLRLRKQNDSLLNQVADLQEKNNADQALLLQISTVLDCSSKNDIILQQFSQSMTELNRLQQLDEGLEENVAILQQKLKSAFAMEQELNNQLSQQKQAFLKLQDENAAQMKQINDQKNQLAQMSITLQQKQEQNEDLMNSQNQGQLSLTQTTQNAAFLSKENAMLKEKTEAYEKQIEEMSLQYQTQNKQYLSLEQIDQSLKSSYNALVAEKTDFIIAANQKFQLDKIFSDSSDLMELSEFIELKIQRKQSELPDLQIRAKTLENNNESLNNQLRKLQGDVQQLKDLRDQIIIILKLDYNALDKDIVDNLQILYNSNVNLKMKTTSADQNIQKQELSLQQLWQKLDQQNAENQKISEQYTQLQIKYADSEKKLTYTSQQLQENAVFLQQAQEELENHKENLKSQRLQDLSQTQHIAELEFTQKQVNRQSGEMQQQIDQLSKQLDETLKESIEFRELSQIQKQQLQALVNDKINFISIINKASALQQTYQSNAVLEDIAKQILLEFEKKPAELNDLQCQCAASKQKIAQLQQELDSAEHQLLELKQFDYIVSNSCKLQNQSFEQKQNAIAQKFTLSEQLQQQNIGLQEICSKNEQSLAKQKEQLIQVTNSYNELKASDSKLQMLYSQLSQENQQCQLKIKEQQLLLQQKEELLIQRASDLSHSQVQLQQTGTETATTQYRFSQLQRDYDALNADNERTKQLFNEQKSLFQALEGRFTAVQGAYDSLKQEKISLLTTANQSFDLEAPVNIDSDMAELANNIAKKLSAKPTELLSLQNENILAKRQNEECIERLQQLQQRAAELQYVRAQACKVLSLEEGVQSAQLIEALQQLAAEHCSFKQQVSGLLQLRQKLEAENTALQQARDELQGSNTDLSDALSALQLQYSEAGKSNARLQGELASVQLLLQQKQEEVVQQSNTLMQSKVTMNQSSQESADLLLQYNTQCKELQQLHGKLQQAARNCDDLKAANSSLQDISSSQRVQLNSLIQQKTYLINYINQNCNLDVIYQPTDDLENIAQSIAECINKVPELLPTMQAALIQVKQQLSESVDKAEALEQQNVKLKQLKFQLLKAIKLTDQASNDDIIQAISQQAMEYENLKIEVVGLREIALKQKSIIEQNNADINGLRAQNDKCQDDCAKLNKELSEKSRQLIEMQNELQTSKILLTQKQEQLVAHSNDLQQTKLRFQETDKINADDQLKIQYYEKESELINSENSQLIQKNQQLTDSLKAITVSFDNVKEQLKMLQNEKVQFIIELNKSAELQTFTIEASLADIVRLVTKELKIRNTSQPELQRQIQIQNGELQQVKEQLRCSQSDVNQLAILVKEIKKIFIAPKDIDFLDYLSKFQAQAASSISELQIKAEKLEKQADLLQKLQQEQIKLISDNQKLKQENTQLQQAIAQLQREHQEVQSQYEDQSKYYLQAQETVADQRQKISFAQQEAGNNVKRISDQQNEIQSLSNQLEIAMGNIKQLTQKNSYQQQQLLSLQSQEGDIRSLNAKLLQEKQQFIVTINSKLKLPRVFDVEDELDQISSALLQYITQQPQITVEMQKQSKQLQEQCSQQQAQLSNMKEQIDRYSQFRNMLFTTLQLTQKQNDSACISIVKSLFENSNDLEMEKQQLQIDNQKFNTLTQELSEKNAQLQKQLTGTTTENSKLKQSLQLLNQEQIATQKKLDDAFLQLQKQEEELQEHTANLSLNTTTISKKASELAHYINVTKQNNVQIQELTLENQRMAQQLQEVTSFDQQLQKQFSEAKQQLKLLRDDKLQFIQSVNDLSLKQVFTQESSLMEVIVPLQDELKQKNIRVPQLQSQLSLLSQQYSDLQNESQELKQQSQQNYKILSEIQRVCKEGDSSKLIIRISDMCKENEELNLSNNRLTTENQRLSQENSTQKQGNIENLQTLNQQQSGIQQLKQQYFDCNNEKIQLKQKLEELHQQLEQQQEKMELLRQERQVTINANTQDVEMASDKELQNQQCIQLQVQNKELTQKITEQQQKVRQFYDKLSKCQLMNQVIDDQTSLDQLFDIIANSAKAWNTNAQQFGKENNQTILQLQSEIQRLKDQNVEQLQLSQNQSSPSFMLEKLLQLQAENTQLKQLAQPNNNGKISELNGLVQQLSEENEALTKKLLELQKENSSIKQQSQLPAITDKLLQLQAENTMLRHAQLQISDVQRQDVLQQENELSRQILKLQETNQQLNQSLIEQQQQVGVLSSENIKLKQNQQVYQDQFKQAMDQNQKMQQSMQQQIASSQNNAIATQLQKQNDSLRMQIQQNTCQINDLTAQLNTAIEQNKQLLDLQQGPDLQDLRGQIDYLQQQNHQLKESFQQQIKKLTEANKNLQISLKNQQNELLFSQQSKFDNQSLTLLQQQIEYVSNQNKTLLTNAKRLADSLGDAEVFRSECLRQFGAFPAQFGCRKCQRLQQMLRDSDTRDQLILKGRKCICIVGSSMYSFDLRVRKMKEFVDVLGDILM